MTVANRTQIAAVVETTLGTTPTTPRMRTARITSGDPQWKRTTVDSDMLRSDRMNDDPIAVMQEADVVLATELYYPADGEPLSNFIRSAMFNPWVNTPTRDNDGTADLVITDVATAGTVVTVTTGAAFVAGQLARFSGFGVANNNGIFKVTTGSATVPAFVGSGITDEAVPPAAAKIKVVGFQGASADITATATGLGSTALNFTLLGLAVGMWVKIGGTAAGDKFATAVLNDRARITAIAATALTLDNLPTGWTTDAGTGKTIKVWFGDYIKNGTTKAGMTIEFGYLGQTTPTYIVATGQIPNMMDINIVSRDKVKMSFTFSGMGGSQSTTALDASPDAASTAQVMAANANVSRMSEAGTKLIYPNCAKEFAIKVNNNLRKAECVDDDNPIDILEGEATVNGNINTYFGSNAQLAKYIDGTATSQSAIIAKNSQAVIFEMPRTTYRDGSPPVQGKNTDVYLPLTWQSSIDTLTNSHIIINRLEYFEA